MILVAGSVSFDHIMDFPGKFSEHILPEKIHLINLSFEVDTLKKERGGTGANICYSLALFGEKPKLLATVGEDFAKYRYHLEKYGVDTSLTKAVPYEFTSSFYVITDKDDNQIGGFYQGAMKHAAELSVKEAKPNKNDYVVIAPTEVTAMVKYAKECNEVGVKYMFDPGMQLPRFTDKELWEGVKGADILIGNDYEISVIRKRLSKENGDLLRDVGILITTMGGKGSVIERHVDSEKHEFLEIPSAKEKEIIDPTGAGDAFRAGFLVGYLNKKDLVTSGKMGNLCATYCIEKYGTTNHEFTRAEFKKRYKENFVEELAI
ncbi:carbohydrate kinase family protein [Candidatus Gottesmanbacteria bacterium]|nr:carbohydrate kinase family protein [Candidatus Gottesmanbacteria bacterium]